METSRSAKTYEPGDQEKRKPTIADSGKRIVPTREHSPINIDLSSPQTFDEVPRQLKWHNFVPSPAYNEESCIDIAKAIEK